MVATASSTFRSPLGVIALEAGDAGVVRITFGGTAAPQAGASAAARAHLDVAEAALADYFAGRPPARLPALDLRGTEFQRAVWAALLLVPFGELRTYGELASSLGRPGCARAVGSANGDNPVAILVPCHRVVQAGGRLGGYAGGVELKRWLLAHEAAHTPALRPLSAAR